MARDTTASSGDVTAGAARAATLTLSPLADLVVPGGSKTFIDVVGGRFAADHEQLVKLCQQLFADEEGWVPETDHVFVDYAQLARPPVKEGETDEGVADWSFLCWRIVVRRASELRSAVTHCFVNDEWLMTFGRQAWGIPALLASFERTGSEVRIGLVGDAGTVSPLLVLTAGAASGAYATTRKLSSLPGAVSAGDLQLILLKQMRDALDPTRACHRVLLRGSAGVGVSAIEPIGLSASLEDGTLFQASDFCLEPAQPAPAQPAQPSQRRRFDADAAYRLPGAKISCPVIESGREQQVVTDGRAGPSLRLRRGDPQAAPGYLFTDVEIVGFRIPVAAQQLEDICARYLNDPFPNRGYNYRPVNVDVVIECLDYGAMLAANPPTDIDPATSSRQRELVFRMLVAREDRDGRPVSTPAVFCPFVFVDSPWSLISGREVIGYPKAMAVFDTKSAGGQFEVCKVAARRFASRLKSEDLLFIDCRFEREPASVEALFSDRLAKPLDPPTRLGRTAPIDFAWWGLADLQSAGANHDSIITPWIEGKSSGYAGLQVKRFPRADQPNQDAYRELVECYYTLLKAEVTLPRHNATLVFPDNDSYGLVEAFGFDSFVPVPPGSWYRTKADFRFNVTDPLA